MSRFDEQPAEPLIESAYRFEIGHAALLHHDLTLADLAHILHMAGLGLIPLDTARVLLRNLLALDGDPQFCYDPRLGDAFSNREDWLRARAPAAAGYLALGRARREATTVAFRLLVRRNLLALSRSVAGLELALIDLAARHTGTLMPDYTYLQQAHPTTFAHYLLAFVYPLQRDAERMRRAFALVNQSPAGIGSTNGSRLPLDRERLAASLGFDAVIVHARDAMWQVDVPLEVAGAALSLMLQLDRLAEDLQVFHSGEFGFVELDDAYARASVIMPQKKNPYALAFVRGAAGSLLGRMVEAFAIAQTPSAQIDNRIFAHGMVPQALDMTKRCAELMAGLCASLIVRPEPMQQTLNSGFTQATDLAELLVTECGADFRTAHRVVGRLVRNLLAVNKSAGDITPSLIEDTAREVAGRPFHLSPEKLTGALDPAAAVAARTGTGGAAPARVAEMLEASRAAVAAQRAWIAETAERTERAEAALLEHARVMCGM